MFAYLLASTTVRVLRRVWLYALLAIASYQLGARSAEPPPQASVVRGTKVLAKHAPSRGYINAPGFHFDD